MGYSILRIYQAVRCVLRTVLHKIYLMVRTVILKTSTLRPNINFVVTLKLFGCNFYWCISINIILNYVLSLL